MTRDHQRSARPPRAGAARIGDGLTLSPERSGGVTQPGAIWAHCRVVCSQRNIPICAVCLRMMGFGFKAIVRSTGTPKTTLHRALDGCAAQVRKAVNVGYLSGVKQRKPPKPRKPKRVPLTREQRNARRLMYYYANHEELKLKQRQYQKALLERDYTTQRAVLTERLRKCRLNVTLGYVRKRLTQNGTILRATDLPIGLVLAEQQRIKLQRMVKELL